MLDLCLTWAAGGATTSGGGRAAQSAWHMTGPPPPHQLEATPRSITRSSKLCARHGLHLWFFSAILRKRQINS